MHRHMPEVQPERLLGIVIAGSSTSLILSLRGAGATCICAASPCDAGTEIEVKESVFEPTALLSDILWLKIRRLGFTYCCAASQPCDMATTGVNLLVQRTVQICGKVTNSI